MSRIDWMNGLGEEEARAQFLACAGTVRWAEQMTKARPFASVDEAVVAGEQLWERLSEADLMEAIANGTAADPARLGSLSQRIDESADLAFLEEADRQRERVRRRLRELFL